MTPDNSAFSQRSSDRLTHSTFPAEALPALCNLLSESASACIVTNQDLRITHWDSDAEKLLGWSRYEVTNTPLENLISDKKKALLNASTRQEFVLKTKSGSPIVLEFTSAEVELESSTPGCVFFLRDISEKKALEQILLQTSEREQRRVGQEMHDHLCQHLLGAAFATKALAGTLERDQSPHAAKLHEIARLINDSVQQTRTISRSMHPADLTTESLLASLHALADRTSLKVPCHFQQETLPESLAPTTALHLYKIAQDVVTAAVHETGATEIHLSLSPQKDSLFLKITDNGLTEGTITREPVSSVARILHCRAQNTHATLTTQFSPTSGTQVCCQFPI